LAGNKGDIMENLPTYEDIKAEMALLFPFAGRLLMYFGVCIIVSLPMWLMLAISSAILGKTAGGMFTIMVMIGVCYALARVTGKLVMPSDVLLPNDEASTKEETKSNEKQVLMESK
jgi:hypothetical protein